MGNQGDPLLKRIYRRWDLKFDLADRARPTLDPTNKKDRLE
jgi:hypothetical protein